MISKIQKPRNKQELIKALQASSIRKVAIYEGRSLGELPVKSDLVRKNVTVIVVSM